MSLLNKHQIFASNDLKSQIISIPEWGGNIKIRVMSIGERLTLDSLKIDEDDKDMNLAFNWIIKSCIDENDKLLFDDPEEDIKFLKGKSSDSILKLFNAILSLNKQSQDDIDDLAKNS